MMQVTPVHRVLNLLAEQWFYHVEKVMQHRLILQHRQTLLQQRLTNGLFQTLRDRSVHHQHITNPQG